jgi:regulatory protein
MIKLSKKSNKYVPKKITPEYLKNSSLYYLSRFSTSAENFKQIMMRKVARSAKYHGTDPKKGLVLVENMISGYLQSGLLDDEAYAKARATNLHFRGNSSRNIRTKLKQKGLKSDIIELAVSSLQEAYENPEQIAAIHFAQRRRLGPFQKNKLNDEIRKKHLAIMARAGFSYEIAKFIIFTLDEEDLLY